jgi:hypothetical protein
MLGFALLLFYNDWGAEIMLRIGKLRDLKYLKVVLAVSLTSLLASILYVILAVFIPGDFFRFFAKITLPVTALIGFLVKRNIDGND